MPVKAVCFGEILFDRFPDGDKLGGAPLNCAWYLAQLGIPPLIVSAVGDDESGDLALATLERAGMETSGVARTELPTGVVDIELTDGQPGYTIREDVAWDAIPMPFPPPHGALLYFGTLAQRTAQNRQTLRALVSHEYQHVYFDINLRAAYYTTDLLDAGLSLASVAKVNEEEWARLRVLLGIADVTDLLGRFHLDGLLITQGARGAEWHTRRAGRIHAQSAAVPLVDAVGAGDAFSAVICAALIRDIPVAHVLQWACDVGAHVVGRRGAQVTLPARLAPTGSGNAPPL